MPHEHAVGHKKPPLHSRFQKGQSGNPKGRPKGRKNLKTDLLEELSEPILIREGERQIRTTKQRALIKSLVAKAMKGDTRAAFALINLMARLLGMEDAGEAAAPLSMQEQEQLAVLEARLGRRAPAAPSALDPALPAAARP